MFHFTFCLKHFLANCRIILLKSAFCIKSARRIQLADENCVSLHFVLRTSFCQIIRISCLKMRFPSNLLKTYKSLLNSSFCVKNFILPNYKAILFKNEFCLTSAQRIEFCVDNSVSRHFVLKLPFAKLYGYLGKTCILHQISSNNSSRC